MGRPVIPLGPAGRLAYQLRRFTLERQQTCSDFTACRTTQRSIVLYSLCTMSGRCSAKARRRKHAAAIVGALSLFVALVAGSALRPHYTTTVLPEPQAWTHAVQHVQPDASRVQPDRATASVEYVIAGNKRLSAPISRKPFRNVWMTHDLPSNWVPLSPQSDWSALPESFAPAQFQPRGAPWGASTADAVNRHTSSLFCIIRC